MATILNGAVLRDKIREDLIKVVSKIPKGSVPKLAIIQVGSIDASTSYIKGKIKFGEEIGIQVVLYNIAETAKEEEVIELVLKLNGEIKVEGIIVQLPLPIHMDKDKIIETIDPHKDIDGLHSCNVKKLFENNKTGMMPATTRGIISVIEAYEIDLTGKRVLMIGRSDLVGKPTALALLNKDATVTIAHHLSKDLVGLCKEAEVIVSATGVPGLITKKHVKKGQVIIDVGINRYEGKIVGDVAYDEVAKVVASISPVPGGVGPLTIASLFQNLLRKYNN